MEAILTLSYLIIIIMLIVFKSIKVVNHSEVYIIERFGKYYKTASSGLTFVFPFIDKIASVVSIRDTVVNFIPKNIMTKDKKYLNINIEIMYQIIDPKKIYYEVPNLKKSIEYIATISVRDTISRINSDELIDKEKKIRNKLTDTLIQNSYNWGYKLLYINILNINVSSNFINYDN